METIKMSKLTPGERTRRMLLGQEVDKIPFTVYENKVYYGKAERELRNDGMCIVQKTPQFFKTKLSNCSKQTILKNIDDKVEKHTVIETSKGSLTSIVVDRGERHNPWHKKMLFSQTSDYEALKTYLLDMSFEENFQAVEEKERQGGGDFFMRQKLGFSPFNDLIYTYIGLERFWFEWADNNDKILELYEILCDKQVKLCEVVKDAPVLAVNVCGNVTANVISPDIFKQYYLPCYNRAVDILHKGGKVCGVHFDGITFPYADSIKESGLDYLEALTPPPTCDVEISKACQLWPDKTLWVNFPSSTHLESEQVIRQTARQILEDARDHKRFLMGITEDTPPDIWPKSFRYILDEVNKFER
ncbi:MAG: uroporphyrinogen decarboxylase family protein [Planctomycetota bacterium]|jgi:hypothetical protein